MPEQCASFIDGLVALRKEKGYSQKMLADACGLTQSVIARIESKKSVPTLTTLYKILDALGVSLALLPADIPA